MDSEKTYNVELTDQEINTLLHGLYIMEDQYWFKGQQYSEPLINKLNQIINSQEKN